MLRKVVASASVASAATVAYDVSHGDLIRRTSRCFAAAASTLYDYKYCFDDQPLHELHRRVARRWASVCITNAGLYVKVGQQIASMNHVLPKEYLEEFKKLEQSANTFEYTEVRKIIKSELGKGVEELFDEFSVEPIASASIAQVHKARIVDSGHWVAIKIQKPEIPAQMRTDLLVYYLLGNALEFFFDIPIAWTIPSTTENIRLELDFTNEADNARRCRAAIEKDGRFRGVVHIPSVYPELTSKRVLTAEWIDGVRVDAVDSLGLCPKEVARKLLSFFSFQLFLTGFLHADPHAGNVLVTKNAKIAVLDHGLYVDLPESVRSEYASMFRAIVLNDNETLTEIATKWGVRDTELFASLQTFRPFSKVSGVVYDPSKIDLLELQSTAKDRVRALLSDARKTPPELALIGRHLNLVRSLNRSLKSPVNRIRVMADFANEGCSNGDSGLEFKARMLLLDCVFFATESFRFFKRVLGYGDDGGFEELLESGMKDQLSQFGMSVDTDIG